MKDSVAITPINGGPESGSAFLGGNATANPMFATQSTITTNYSDSGLSLNEKDSEAGTTNTINSENYSDSPKVSILATFTYGQLVVPGSGGGKETMAVNQSQTESVNGSGAGAKVSLSTSSSTTDDVSGWWATSSWEGEMSHTSSSSQTDTIKGTESSASQDSLDEA